MLRDYLPGFRECLAIYHLSFTIPKLLIKHFGPSTNPEIPPHTTQSFLDRFDPSQFALTSNDLPPAPVAVYLKTHQSPNLTFSLDSTSNLKIHLPSTACPSGRIYLNPNHGFQLHCAPTTPEVRQCSLLAVFLPSLIVMALVASAFVVRDLMMMRREREVEPRNAVDNHEDGELSDDGSDVVVLTPDASESEEEREEGWGRLVDAAWELSLD